MEFVCVGGGLRHDLRNQAGGAQANSSSVSQEAMYLWGGQVGAWHFGAILGFVSRGGCSGLLSFLGI